MFFQLVCVKDEKSFIAGELRCVRTAARPHPSVREGRMNWGWRIKARIHGFVEYREYRRKVQKKEDLM